MTPFLRKLLGLNWLLLVNMLALAVFGVIAIYSATYMKQDPAAAEISTGRHWVCPPLASPAMLRLSLGRPAPFVDPTPSARHSRWLRLQAPFGRGGATGRPFMASQHTGGMETNDAAGERRARDPDDRGCACSSRWIRLRPRPCGMPTRAGDIAGRWAHRPTMSTNTWSGIGRAPTEPEPRSGSQRARTAPGMLRRLLRAMLDGLADAAVEDHLATWPWRSPGPARP